MDVEDLRVRIVVVKWGSDVKAERIEGPSLPPAPTVIDLVRGYERLGNGNILRRTFLI